MSRRFSLGDTRLGDTAKPGDTEKLLSTFSSFHRAGKRLAGEIPDNPAATYVKFAMNSAEVDQRLIDGIPVIKAKSHGRQKKLFLTISEDRLALFVTSTKIHLGEKINKSNSIGLSGLKNLDEKARYIDIGDIDFINCAFVCTQKLENARSINRSLGQHDSFIDVRKENIVSIAYEGSKFCDVFIENEELRTKFIDTLITLRHNYGVAKYLSSNEDRLLRYIWYRADSNKDGKISPTEFQSLLEEAQLYVKLPLEVFKKFAKEKNVKTLDYHQCMTLIQSIRKGKYETENKRKSVAYLLWHNLFGGASYVPVARFLEVFVHGCQKETDTCIDDVCQLLRALHIIEMSRDNYYFPFIDGFVSFSYFELLLFHEFNDAFDPEKQELDPKNMNRPLTEYWINSSHNTYLAGDQLQSNSSIEMYTTCLHRGCKCLELDCWDGKTIHGKPLPVIYHGVAQGVTLTSKILFRDVIECVSNYAENHPDGYPIILSLENHCSVQYQEEMALVLDDILGNMLYAPFDENRCQRYGHRFLQETDLLPSPTELKGYVLIKGKRLPDQQDDEQISISSFCSETGKENYITSDSSAQNSPENQGISKNREGKNSHSLKQVTKGLKKTQMSFIEEEKMIKHSKIAPVLAILTMFHGCKYKRSFDESIILPPSHMHSIAEKKIKKILKKDSESGSKWRIYNMTHMTRTYPAGKRIDSSNYNPIIPWAVGSQMVALNFQSPSTASYLNDGRFRQNGHCGYVLKPPSAKGILPLHQEPLIVRIRILSGSCLPPKHNESSVDRIIDPFIKIRVHDALVENCKEVHQALSKKTKYIDNNGFNPVWAEEKFHEFEVHLPDVAIMEFLLLDSNVGNDEVVGFSAIPVSCLRRGYRSILIRNKQACRTGRFDFAMILADIQICSTE